MNRKTDKNISMVCYFQNGKIKFSIKFRFVITRFFIQAFGSYFCFSAAIKRFY